MLLQEPPYVAKLGQKGPILKSVVQFAKEGGFRRMLTDNLVDGGGRGGKLACPLSRLPARDFLQQRLQLLVGELHFCGQRVQHGGLAVLRQEQGDLVFQIGRHDVSSSARPTASRNSSTKSVNSEATYHRA